jgi:hypothetical protein
VRNTESGWFPGVETPSAPCPPPPWNEEAARDAPHVETDLGEARGVGRIGGGEARGRGNHCEEREPGKESSHRRH